MNWYLATNIAAGIGCFCFLVLALSLEKFSWRKISTKHLAIIALFIACNVILTNLLSYNLPILPGGVKIALGDWILFLNGALFGPLAGFIGAVTGDSLGALANIGGVYHAGFMFDKVVLSFFGSLVFIFKKNNFLILKVVLFYAVALAFESFLFNPIWLYASGWGNAIFVNLVIKAIKYPIILIIYSSFVMSSLAALNPLIVRWQVTTNVWCLRHGLFWQISKKSHNRDKININKGEQISYE